MQLKTLTVSLLSAILLGFPQIALSHSSATTVDITRSEEVGDAQAGQFRRISGTLNGNVASSEAVSGLRELADGRSQVPYRTTFELLLPAQPGRVNAVIVGANNRGNAIAGHIFSVTSSSPSAGQVVTDGEAFLLRHGFAIANIQWQTGHSAGVPQSAQGIGQVVVRDFGRLLGGAKFAGRSGLPEFRYRILVGISQSAWFVNAFIAEGFNVDPMTGRGVYQGAFTRNGAGNVLAINAFAGAKPQIPYIHPEAAPLTPQQLLTRPRSDPFTIEVTSPTDFYRLHAGVFTRAAGSPRLRRYGSHSPHAPGSPLYSSFVFSTLNCNQGHIIPLDQTTDGPYLRPLILALAKRIGVKTTTQLRLDGEALLALRPATAEQERLNRLHGTSLWVPQTDIRQRGGLPMLESVFPLGVSFPEALPPVAVSSLNDTCGNFAGWQPFDAMELTRRYASRAELMRTAEAYADVLVKKHMLIPSDRAAALTNFQATIPEYFQ